jgi:hypothetical protein
MVHQVLNALHVIVDAASKHTLGANFFVAVYVVVVSKLKYYSAGLCINVLELAVHGYGLIQLIHKY